METSQSYYYQNTGSGASMLGGCLLVYKVKIVIACPSQFSFNTYTYYLKSTSLIRCALLIWIPSSAPPSPLTSVHTHEYRILESVSSDVITTDIEYIINHLMFWCLSTSSAPRCFLRSHRPLSQRHQAHRFMGEPSQFIQSCTQLNHLFSIVILQVSLRFTTSFSLNGSKLK